MGTNPNMPIEKQNSKPEVKETINDPNILYYTTAEIKKIFKIKSDVTINNWITSGKLKPTKVGRKNLFLKKEIEQLLESQKINLS